MTTMTTPTDPEERARKYARYKRAHQTVKELKPEVDAMAAEDLQAGATITQLAERTGMGEEVFRRMARKLEIPIDPRYRERAERLRARAAADPSP